MRKEWTIVKSEQTFSPGRMSECLFGDPAQGSCLICCFYYFMPSRRAYPSSPLSPPLIIQCTLLHDSPLIKHDRLSFAPSSQDSNPSNLHSPHRLSLPTATDGCQSIMKLSSKALLAVLLGASANPGVDARFELKHNKMFIKSTKPETLPVKPEPSTTPSGPAVSVESSAATQSVTCHKPDDSPVLQTFEEMNLARFKPYGTWTCVIAEWH